MEKPTVTEYELVMSALLSHGIEFELDERQRHFVGYVKVGGLRLWANSYGVTPQSDSARYLLEKIELLVEEHGQW